MDGQLSRQEKKKSIGRPKSSSEFKTDDDDDDHNTRSKPWLEMFLFIKIYYIYKNLFIKSIYLYYSENDSIYKNKYFIKFKRVRN